MHRKIEERFGASFSPSQITLLREYVFSEKNGVKFRAHLADVKRKSVESLSGYSVICENKILSGQIEKVQEQVLALDVDKFDDDSISKYLTLMKLTEELTSGEEFDGRP